MGFWALSREKRRDWWIFRDAKCLLCGVEFWALPEKPIILFPGKEKEEEEEISWAVEEEEEGQESFWNIFGKGSLPRVSVPGVGSLYLPISWHTFLQFWEKTECIHLPTYGTQPIASFFCVFRTFWRIVLKQAAQQSVISVCDFQSFLNYFQSHANVKNRNEWWKSTALFSLRQNWIQFCAFRFWKRFLRFEMAPFCAISGDKMKPWRFLLLLSRLF